MDDEGRLAVSDEPRWTDVKVYDGSGEHSKTLGRAGEGPGEYRHVAGLRFGPGDSLYVFDWGLWRLTVYGPELEDPVRTTPLPVEPLYRVLVLEDGRLVLSSTMGAPDLVGLPIHVIGPDGDHLHSFGNDGAWRPGDAAGPTGELLASTTLPYELSSFARPGVMFRTDLSESLEPVARLYRLRLEPR